MSINLSPVSTRGYSVGAANDPYKKYWWGILAGFIVTGAWLSMPMMEGSVGSTHVDTTAKATVDGSADQSLDSAENPNGAAGGALSMDGIKHKSLSGDDMNSMLFQAGPEPGAAASGKPLGDATAAAATGSLAQQLKDAGKAADASGWNEKAQRGFAPAAHLSGSGLSGVGSASGGSSASAGGGYGGGSAFGSHSAQTGSESTKGLHDDGGGSAGFKALKAAAGKAGSPNLKGSDEAMHAGMAHTFDGAGKAGAPIAGGAMGQANAAFDAAPANLKANDPKLDTKKLPDPPMAPPTTGPGADQFAKQMAMMVATAVIGGMIGGAAGGMVMMMGQTLMQQQQQQQAAADAAKQQQTVNKRMGTS